MTDDVGQELESLRNEWLISSDNPRGWENEGKKVERRVLATLPRKDAFVFLDAAICRSVAACVICERPVAKGSAVLAVRVKLPEPRRNTDGTTRDSEKFVIHAGCLIAGFDGQHDLKRGDDCFDCGAPPEFRQGHPWKAYASTRHAPVPLCKQCATRNRWRPCESCIIYYPAYMVSRVVTEGPSPDWDEGAEGTLDMEGMNVCEYCATRAGVKTLFQQRRETEEFEQLRAKMATGKVFSS